MKKYKLIKEYPGSPKLGTIVEQRLDTNFEDEHGRFFYGLEIKYYPEFWEEVKKKEYEILSFADVFNIHDVKVHSVKRLSDGEVFTIDDDIKTGKIQKFEVFADDVIVYTTCGNSQSLTSVEKSKRDFEIIAFTDVFNEYRRSSSGFYVPSVRHSFEKLSFTENQLLKSPLVKIKIVKRLSDGEVFTVGDIIEDEDGRDYKNTGIKEFTVDGEGNLDIITDANGNGIVTKDLSWTLEEINHKKKPLFITEDGVDIFECDEYCFINNNEIYYNLCASDTGYDSPHKHYKTFSKGKLAEEYLQRNKKKYTKEEVEKLCRDAFFNGILTAHIAKERWSETLNEWLKNNLK